MTRRKTKTVEAPYVIKAGPVYWSFAIANLIIGVVLIAAPQNWYGPSWSYFSAILPHNGFGMGLCCIILGGLEVVALSREATARILAIFFFFGGFIYWTAGIILGAEGLFGHEGLMEAPFMLLIAAHKFALSASLWAHYRVGRRK